MKSPGRGRGSTQSPGREKWDKRDNAMQSPGRRDTSRSPGRKTRQRKGSKESRGSGDIDQPRKENSADNAAGASPDKGRAGSEAAAGGPACASTGNAGGGGRSEEAEAAPAEAANPLNDSAEAQMTNASTAPVLASPKSPVEVTKQKIAILHRKMTTIRENLGDSPRDSKKRAPASSDGTPVERRSTDKSEQSGVLPIPLKPPRTTGSVKEPMLVAAPLAGPDCGDDTISLHSSDFVMLRPLPYVPVAADEDDNNAQRTFVYRNKLVVVPMLPLERLDKSKGNANDKDKKRASKWNVVKSKIAHGNVAQLQEDIQG